MSDLVSLGGGKGQTNQLHISQWILLTEQLQHQNSPLQHLLALLRQAPSTPHAGGSQLQHPPSSGTQALAPLPLPAAAFQVLGYLQLE